MKNTNRKGGILNHYEINSVKEVKTKNIKTEHDTDMDGTWIWMQVALFLDT